jgi:hypothetical protein
MPHRADSIKKSGKSATAKKRPITKTKPTVSVGERKTHGKSEVPRHAEEVQTKRRKSEVEHWQYSLHPHPQFKYLDAHEWDDIFRQQPDMAKAMQTNMQIFSGIAGEKRGKGRRTAERTLQIFAEFDECESTGARYATVARAKRHGITQSYLETLHRRWLNKKRNVPRQ